MPSGILIADGSDAKAIAAVSKAVTAAGATVKIVAPKVGGAKLADGFDDARRRPARGHAFGPVRRGRDHPLR